MQRLADHRASCGAPSEGTTEAIAAAEQAEGNEEQAAEPPAETTDAPIDTPMVTEEAPKQEEEASAPAAGAPQVSAHGNVHSLAACPG